MGKDWEYVKLSEEAKAMGGADKVLDIICNLDIIKQNEFDKGFARGESKMAGKMAPWIAVTAVLGVGGTLLVQEIQKKGAKRKAERRLSDELAAEAESCLIDALNQCEKAEPAEFEPAGTNL